VCCKKIESWAVYEKTDKRVPEIHRKYGLCEKRWMKMKISRKFVVYKVRPPTLKYFQSTHKQMDTTSPTALTPCTYFRRHRTLFSCPIKCLIKVDVPEVIQRIGTLCSADEDDPFGSWSVASNKHAPANIP
jgi:hypothetical protein